MQIGGPGATAAMLQTLRTSIYPTDVAAVSKHAHQVLTEERLRSIVQLVPDELLGDEAEERREEYVRFFTERMASSSIFEEEVLRARAKLV